MRGVDRLVVTIVSASLLATYPAAAQLPGQSFTVTPDTGVFTVGDSVGLRFRIRLNERDLQLDSIPEVTGELAPGVRVLSIEKLTRLADRVYDGSARIAFYRTGSQAVPTFGLPFMRVVEGVSRATLPSDSARVEVSAILPAGNPSLRDIEEIEPRAGPRWPMAILGLLLTGLGCLLLRRRRRAGVGIVEHGATVPPPPERTPYDIAIERLDRLEADRWVERGKVDLHYEIVAETLRQYLEEEHGIGALERTTSELLWALPPDLGRHGLRDLCHQVLAEADLVKFAELRPSLAQPFDFLARARRLLAGWHEAGFPEEADALR